MSHAINLPPDNEEKTTMSHAGILIRCAAIAVVAVLTGVSFAQPPKTNDASKPTFEPATEKNDVLARFEALRLGALILDPMLAGEGYWGGRYDEFFKLPTRPATDYRPTKLDVEGWVSGLAKAGIQYAVCNAKELNGFCLWDSKYTDYDVAASAYKTDVLDQFVKACRKHGVAPSFHYCLDKDRYQQRDKRLTEAQYDTYVHNQIKELMTCYGPLHSIWFSGDSVHDAEIVSSRRRLEDAYETIKAAQPDCLVVVHHNGHKPGKGFHRWPTDVYQPSVKLPPAEGHNPRMPHGDKTYYIPYEVFVRFHATLGGPLHINRPVAEVVQNCREAIQRGASATLLVEVEQDGTLSQKQVERLLEVKTALKDLLK